MNEENPNPEKKKSHLFGPGNKAAAGHKRPHHKAVRALQNCIYEEVTPEELSKIVRKLIWKAKRGDVKAAQILLDRSLGKPVQSMEMILNEGDGDMREFTQDELMRMIMGDGNNNN
ncbi:hypothetical protein C4577_03630 [Candidatus Parcubacteria bacterium]|nr:MAG: hypothetical protein C4577_03630 [Candidatus Parcubacteria bacterium]